MKQEIFGHGEIQSSGSYQLTVGSTNYVFAQLWPESSSLKQFDGEWLEFNEKDVGCRIRNKTARALESSCLSFSKCFLSDADVGIVLKNLIAKDCNRSKNQRTVLLVAGNNACQEVTDRLSNAVAFMAERLMQSQPDMLSSDGTHGLAMKEIEFLLEQNKKIRESLSGDSITHPFGVETLGSNRVLVAFSGRFDDYEYDLPPAEEINGIAIVDGFREFHNSVYLSLTADNKVIEVSKQFLIQDTTLIKKIAEAKHLKNSVRYTADMVFEKKPDKPTFILKEVEILR